MEYIFALTLRYKCIAFVAPGCNVLQIKWCSLSVIE